MKTKPTKPRRKQHDARAASFKRIAKAIRRATMENYGPLASETRPMRLVAKAIENEAILLRSMR